MITINIATEHGKLSDIIDLRYKVLLQPWEQRFELATDDLEKESINVFADEDGKVIGCGRLQTLQGEIGQIRFMAVSNESQGKGVGKKLLEKLEDEARSLNFRKIVLFVRENALIFYEKSGYSVINKGQLLWDKIQHYKMEKDLLV